MKEILLIRVLSLIIAGSLLGLVFSNFSAGVCFAGAISSIYTVVISKVIRK